jgi:hypothetical protein
LRGVGGAVAAGDLELRFGRPQIAFGLVVCEWHREVPGEQQNLLVAVAEPLEQVAGPGLAPARDASVLGEANEDSAPIQWALTRPGDCLATAERAVGLLEPDGDSARRVWALSYHGRLLTTVDRWSEALPLGDTAVEMAQRLGAGELLGLAEVLRGRARLRLANEETGYTIARVATDRSGTDLLTVVGARRLA